MKKVRSKVLSKTPNIPDFVFIGLDETNQVIKSEEVRQRQKSNAFTDFVQAEVTLNLFINCSILSFFLFSG